MEQEIDCESELYGGSVLKYERAKSPHRLKPGDFWQGLENLASGRGVLADWDWAFGDTFVAIARFLWPVGERSANVPCPAEHGCTCRHEVRWSDACGWIAVCVCHSEDWPCETFEVSDQDMYLHALDRRRFLECVRNTLDFQWQRSATYERVGLSEIGWYEEAATPVFFSAVGSEPLLRELHRMMCLRDGPFLLLTPTGSACTAEVERTLRERGAGHIALSSVVEILPGARFCARATLAPMLAEFVRRVASAREPAAVLSNIHREIASVRTEFVELKGAKQRLEKMLADGMFAFTSKVDATSFHAFCTILGKGDVSKAARALGMGDSTLRDLLREWRGRGPAYAKMLDVVRWRKRVGRRETVMLNEDIISGKAPSAERPELLSEVLDGLLSMTEGNWQDLSTELAEMLRS
jgi:hypothetical protein